VKDNTAGTDVISERTVCQRVAVITLFVRYQC